MYTPLSIISPIEGVTLKRGNTYPLKWTGGGQAIPTVEVLKGGNQLFRVDKTITNNSVNLSLPSNLKPGKNYSVSLSTNNGAVTSNFSVKRKIPIVVKIAPLVLLGGAAYIIFSRNSKDGITEGEVTPVEQELPTPQNPPTR